MLDRRFLAIATLMRLATATLAVALGVWAGTAVPGWAYGCLLAVNLGFDLTGGLVARRRGEPPPAQAAASLILAKLVYALLFVILALRDLMPSWLAVALAGRDLALAAGALWLWWRTGTWPAATIHERWPAQLLLAVLALSAAGMPGLQPVVLLLFGLVLTRLPGFWFRFCELLDPPAYHPELSGAGAWPPGVTWQQAVRATLARPSTRLTLVAVPAGVLAVALAAVWLAEPVFGMGGLAARLAPSTAHPAFESLAALIDRTSGCTGWNTAGGSAVLTFFFFLPALLVLPGLVVMHLHEISLHRPMAQAPRLWPGLFNAGSGALVTLTCLVMYVVAGRILIGPRLDCLLGRYGGLGLFAAGVALLSAAIPVYARRFPHEPPLLRLQIGSGSLSTPAIVVLLGQLLGLFSPRQAIIAVAAMVVFVTIIMLSGYRRPARASTIKSS